MRILNYLCIVFSTVALVYGDVDYCKICQDHIGCNNDGKPASNCYATIKINQGQKDYIVQKHNAFRDQIAGGKIDGYPEAERMVEVIWDDEIAETAQLNAITCKFEHDKCRNTPNWKLVGQNIAQIGVTADFLDLNNDIIDGLIASWTNEYKFANVDLIKKLTSIENSKGQTGHFTQVVFDQVVRIGCGASQFERAMGGKKFNMTHLTCNYAYSQLSNGPVYKIGSAASKCKSGRSANYAALCSPKEEVNLDDYVRKMFSKN